MVSTYARNLLQQNFPEAAAKVVITPGALRTDLAVEAPAAQNRRKIVILTVARINPRKGQREVITALQALPDALRDRVEYWLVGGHNKENYAASLTAAAASADFPVKFLGDIPDEKLGAIYAQADIFAMTSMPHRHSVEGFGLVYLEAGVHGLPVIAHAIGGVPEAVIDGETGLLVTPGDGAALTAWIEGQSAERRAQPAGLWLRRASPDFSLDEAILLAPDSGQRPRGQPRLALVRDFTGEAPSATLLVAYTNGTSSAPGIRTLLVTVPEAELLAAANRDCNCAPTPAELLGFSLRATVTAVDAARGEITAKHSELPGLLLSGTHTFKVAPDVLASLAPGRDFLGRIEQRAGTWWLFSIRLLAAPPAKK